MENIDKLIKYYLIPLNFRLIDADLNGFEEFTLITDTLSYKVYIHRESKLNKLYIFENSFSNIITKEDDYYGIIAHLKENFKYELRKIKIKKLKDG